MSFGYTVKLASYVTNSNDFRDSNNFYSVTVTIFFCSVSNQRHYNSVRELSEVGPGWRMEEMTQREDF